MAKHFVKDPLIDGSDGSVMPNLFLIMIMLLM